MHGPTPQGVSKGLYCRECRRKTIHVTYLPLMGCVLTVLSLGLFLPVWLVLLGVSRHWTCSRCGTSRSGWSIRNIKEVH